MPFVEQLLYGCDAGQDKANRSVLAFSPGLGQDVAAEIRRLCDNWGDLPIAGLAAPAIMSVPLKATMPSMRGRLFAVMQLAAGDEGLVHAVVINDPDYAAYGRNPYALRPAIGFLEEWRPGLILDRRQLTEIADTGFVDPPPARTDMALVTEAIRHLLTKNKLLLPLEQPGPGSDRALAMIIAALPLPLAKELRFASWCGSESNGYSLGAVSTKGCPFTGWQRLLMAEVAAIVPKEIETYAKAVGVRLAAADLHGLCRLGRDQGTVPGRGAKSPAGGARTPFGTPTPPPRRTATPAAPRRHSPSPQVAKPAAPRRNNPPPQAAKPAKPATPPPAAQARSMRPSVREASEPPTSPSPRRKTKSRTSRLVKAGQAVGVRSRHRPGRRRVIPLVVAGVVAAAIVWMRMPEISRYFGERLGWFETASDSADDMRATTLLQVVDVGAVYERNLKAVARAAVGQDGNPDRDRRKSQVGLLTDAAAPLLEQVDLFVELATAGIQQGGRPDRERERLKSLSGQGRVLEQEVRRLELAWFSLATGADWRDLGRLDDKLVAARRDSVRKRAADAFTAGTREVGTDKAWDRLHVARRHIDGMAVLLEGFQADRWSERWEQRLHQAAEQVSPSASPMTRAYRNSAFAFVRLKRAERSRSAAELPYAEGFADGSWPSREVRDVLPELRKQAARFGAADAPVLLTSTLALYAALEKSSSLARDATGGQALEELTRCPAARFDPEHYADYFERIRFEAARSLLDSDEGQAGIPGHLYSGQDSLMAHRFFAALAETTGATAWRVESMTQEQPFLARWAQRKADAAFAAEVERRNLFEGEWSTCRSLYDGFRERVARGRDWTTVWLDLREQLVELLDRHIRTAAGDRERSRRLAGASEVLRSLEAPRVLELEAVTVRLAEGSLAAAGPVVVELHAPGRGMVFRSDAVPVGPAAPAGTGWVGTRLLSWELEVGATDALSARVFTPDGQVLVEVDYPSLADRVGPGGMVRPRGDEAGTLVFRVDDSWWQGLALPPLE